jgi:hypothetical protein
VKTHTTAAGKKSILTLEHVETLKSIVGEQYGFSDEEIQFNYNLLQNAFDESVRCG